MGGERGKELEDDTQASGLGVTDGNMDPPKEEQSFRDGGRKRRKGRLVLRGLRWLWMEHTGGNVKDRASNMVL